MKKHRLVRRVPVEEGSGNVYADLGYAASDSMLVKAQLAAKIAENADPVGPGVHIAIKPTPRSRSNGRLILSVA